MSCPAADAVVVSCEGLAPSVRDGRAERPDRPGRRSERSEQILVICGSVSAAVGSLGALGSGKPRVAMAAECLSGSLFYPQACLASGWL